jgi:acetyl-CoA C-acetyltransferase
MMNPNTPVIVGVAQLKHRIESLEDTIEPLDLMLQACKLAEEDTRVRLLNKIQSVRVVRGMWTYANPARYIAGVIGAAGAQTVGTLFGGNYNQVIVNATAASILSGELDLVLLTGAEAGYSGAKARKAGTRIGMRDAPGTYDVLFGESQKSEHHDYEMARGIRSAIQVYPMYENAIRYHRGESIDEHMGRVSELWARFSEVAQGNRHAWIREAVSAEQIRSISAGNRAVSFPYTKLMNSNNAVDMAAALVMCSVRQAKQLSIPEHLWIYPHAGVEGHDHFSASVRDNFYTSPGIRLVGNRLFDLTDVNADDLEYVDLYSCFPSAVQIAAMELGLPEDRPLTVTGGLTFGGGPLNNYVMHSIARMVELLRESPQSKGLITANGGNLYKHAHAVYSGEPPERDFQRVNVQERIDELPARECLAAYTGSVTIESYTVMYAAGQPSIAHVACLTPDGQRVWVNSEDQHLVRAMTCEEFCGRNASIGGDNHIRILS